MNETIARALLAAIDAETPREDRAQAAARLVRDAGGYRWVGIYDVGDEEVGLIGHSGSTPPAHTRFSITLGLSGAAISARSTVVSDDGPGSEAIVPILGAESGIVIGTLDAQSDRTGAFSAGDVAFLEECAEVLRPLYD
ncbi:MAG TPA: GAF domain-containing protein [Candidatus Acidoferrales bacterium]|jgi:putative methionine-R-sulfoxide reductase with GAF domain|nr:GAF domain-containing protein [Candidatus Acidoferrales bacterium]